MYIYIYAVFLAMFTLFDKDKDGKLSKLELKNALKILYRIQAENKANPDNKVTVLNSNYRINAFLIA